jgi:hypothetical protein
MFLALGISRPDMGCHVNFDYNTRAVLDIEALPPVLAHRWWVWLGLGHVVPCAGHMCMLLIDFSDCGQELSSRASPFRDPSACCWNRLVGSLSIRGVPRCCSSLHGFKGVTCHGSTGVHVVGYQHPYLLHYTHYHSV